MSNRWLPVLIALPALFALAACSDPTGGPVVNSEGWEFGENSGPADVGPADVGPADVGPADVGQPDADLVDIETEDIEQVDTCLAAPVCPEGSTPVASASDCPSDDVLCFEESECGATIWCWAPLLPSAPVPYEYSRLGGLEPRFAAHDRVPSAPLEPSQTCTLESGTYGVNTPTDTVIWTYDDEARLIEFVKGNYTYTFVYGASGLIEMNGGALSEDPVIMTRNQYAYDERGRLITDSESVDGVAVTVSTMSYDEDDRIIGLTQLDVASGETREMVYTYNDIERTMAIESPGSSTLAKFHEDGRVEWYERDLGPAFGGRLRFGLTYDEGDRLVRKHLFRPGSTEVMVAFAFSYDGAGNLSVLEADPVSPSSLDPDYLSAKVTLSYDEAGRLTGAEKDVNMTGTNENYLTFSGANCRPQRMEFEFWARSPLGFQVVDF